MNKSFLYILLILLIIAGCKHKSTAKKGSAQNDSLDEFLKIAYDDHLPYATRYKNNMNALEIIEKQPNDSMNRVYYFRVANRFWNMDDTINYKKITYKILKKVQESKDSFALAKVYNYLSDACRNIPDSSYYYTYLSQKIYIKLKDTIQIAGIILKKASEQFDYKDFTGCEKSIYKALTFLKSNHEKYDEKKMYCYSTLGAVNDAFQEFDKSLTYYKKALEISKNLNKNNFDHPYEYVMISMGLLYQNQYKFKESIPFFKKALQNKDLFVHHPKLYHLGLINLIYSSLKIGIEDSIPTKLLKIDNRPEKFKFKDAKVDIKYVLSQYYAIKKDTTQALIFANEAYQIAWNNKMRRTTLLTLKQLASLYPRNASKYLNEYIRIQDSLQLVDRKTTEKFARIEFETDNLIQQKKQLELDRDKKDRKLITAVSLFTLAFLLLIVIYLLNRHRLKNRELRLIKQQHDANEEIYRLLLAQQQQLDEGKQHEKKRIAKELHDGVMGRLTSIRLNLFILSRKRDDETVDKCLTHINDIQAVEKEIRNIAYDLGTALDEGADFMAIVRNIFIGLEQHSGIRFELQTDETIDWQAIDSHIKMQLHRILQESLQNIIKYANPHGVKVNISRIDGHLQLVVQDDGIGFDLKKIHKGFGLNNMKERAEDISGKLKIQSKPGVGTTITLTLPLIQKSNI